MTLFWVGVMVRERDGAKNFQVIEKYIFDSGGKDGNESVYFFQI